MFSVPIPILVCGALLIAAIRIIRQPEASAGAWPFVALLVIAAVQAVLVSLRWDFHVTALLPLQAGLSLLLPGLSWISITRLRSPEGGRLSVADAFHFLPAAVGSLATILAPLAVDLVIAATFAAYGLAFLRVVLRGSDALTGVTFAGMMSVHRALGMVTFALLGSSSLDFAVIADFALGGGAHAPLLVGIGNLTWLMVLVYFTLIAAHSMPAAAEHTVPEAYPSPTDDDLRVIERVKSLLVNDENYKDSDLTLARLARRCGVSSRQISRAVNEVYGQNVSQFVNGMRVAEACRLLESTDASITSIIYESGFQTKSNFNREFLRVTGKTPSQWRNEKGRSKSAPAPR